jgi:hypothetical protein
MDVQHARQQPEAAAVNVHCVPRDGEGFSDSDDEAIPYQDIGFDRRCSKTIEQVGISIDSLGQSGLQAIAVRD